MTAHPPIGDVEVAQNFADPLSGRAPLILGAMSAHDITEVVCRPIERPAPTGWRLFFGLALALLAIYVSSTIWLFYEGTGIWGVNNPVAWGWATTNFVFWIGIAHAGTLISAILFLLRQRWRTSISRFAEGMTLFAIVCAFTFPIIHVGRVWLLYWVFPIPNQMGLWPNFQSPLTWDVFAILAYAIVSIIFFYLGLIPDLATLRDRARTRRRQVIYGLFALGWRGSARHWRTYERAYGLLAGLATALVISVHSIVSIDFAATQLPGWHQTLFPPYFVAGAIFSGLALVMTLLLITRAIFALQQLITPRHLDNLAKLILFTSLLIIYAYVVEGALALYGNDPHEVFALRERIFGPHAWAYAVIFLGNIILPQLLWSHRLRRRVGVLFTVAIGVNIAMWVERFAITVPPLAKDFLPASWGTYTPTFFDVAALAGSFGLFFSLFALFIRFVPVVALADVKRTAHALSSSTVNATPRSDRS